MSGFLGTKLDIWRVDILIGRHKFGCDLFIRSYICVLENLDIMIHVR